MSTINHGLCKDDGEHGAMKDRFDAKDVNDEMSIRMRRRLVLLMMVMMLFMRRRSKKVRMMLMTMVMIKIIMAMLFECCLSVLMDSG
jgi:hypothetical protein